MITRDGEGGIWFRPYETSPRYRLDNHMSRNTTIALIVAAVLIAALGFSTWMNWVEFSREEVVDTRP